ncbi:MAG: hypothetical protein JO184_01325 [Gammaproteobacteria bacterium]|nr:hypothetical protein [Gammaproteobacteria bacterium]MBV8306851.1 hypothetical protein [Gammaproteobacteria bacterium]
MSLPSQPTPTVRFLSRRARAELGALQASVHELGAFRNAALRIFLASRHAATAVAQRDFWLEFSWADQEYRVAVGRLAEFCVRHRDLAARQVPAE